MRRLGMKQSGIGSVRQPIVPGIGLLIGLTGVAATVAVATYFVISEGSRIVFPPRNLVPVP